MDWAMQIPINALGREAIIIIVYIITQESRPLSPLRNNYHSHRDNSSVVISWLIPLAEAVIWVGIKPFPEQIS